ncbi:methyltransferase domain-containing protein [Gemmatimonas groenlandica]|uniref:Methyltransferase domain-containing protein n=1 Tax=Gemmatimonas groenlandica TaxID=2732249 RepID=A0A6M4IJI9_9BACT|nr:methyltransferase domain-containing protein [Gemmatimonas groenlandica]QJR34235.1 methyltransferase domain-containing protein [Gemmatimonas groenlandica]
MFTPARQRGSEILDDPGEDPALALRSLRDVALANRFFGGRRAVLAEVRRELLRQRALDGASTAITLLDIGTGLGDIPRAAQRMAAGTAVPLTTIGVELVPALAHAASAACTHALAADAMVLPFHDGSIDIVTCSQVLHHFDGAEAERLLQECTRVARSAVIIGDLRRSWFAVAGLWAASFVLGFHPVSRHDGIVSILRGFTRDELQRLVERATGCPVRTGRALGFRVVAVWSPLQQASRRS